MKEENMKRAKEIIGRLEANRLRLKYCEDENAVIEINLFREGRGGTNIGYRALPDETQSMIKTIAGAEIKKQIKLLEAELETL